VPERRGSSYCPRVFCAHCGERLAGADDGNGHWRYGEEFDGVHLPLYFTHKRCCISFERSRGGLWAWDELRLLPVYLVNNLDVPIAVRRAPKRKTNR
jgi:hypothetical protein